MVFNQIHPKSINEKDAYFENNLGKDAVHWRMKAKSFPEGWTALVPLNNSYTFSFMNSTQFTNITYDLNAEELGPNDYVYLKHVFKQTPDHFSTVRNGQEKNLEQLPSLDVNKHGDWFFEEDKSQLTYLLSGIPFFFLGSTLVSSKMCLRGEVISPISCRVLHRVMG